MRCFTVVFSFLLLVSCHQGRIVVQDDVEQKFIWPVDSRYVTTYFHDPNYLFRHMFEHPGIDLGVEQGTPIVAIQSGYVARAKMSQKNFSYIMINHEKDLASIFGHLSNIYVKKGQYVAQGQIIGLSGGKIGTEGAGRLSTGPHLHLEVRLKGVPVDPLLYLSR